MVVASFHPNLKEYFALDIQSFDVEAKNVINDYVSGGTSGVLGTNAGEDYVL